MRFLVLFMLISQVCFADVFVLVNSDNTIQSIDKDNLSVANKEQRKVILKGDIAQYSDLTYQDDFYVLDGNKIKLNAVKLEAESTRESNAKKAKEKAEKIQKKMEQMAEQALIDSGELEAE